MDHGRRAHYRVQPDHTAGLMVSVTNPEGSPFVGRLVDVSASGASLSFTGSDWPMLAVGQEVDLLFTSDDLKVPLTIAARTQHRREVEGCRRYGFRFLQTQQFDSYLPAAIRQIFNRRRAMRVAPDSARPVHVSLRPGLEDRPVDVRLQNLSPLGIGVSLEVAFEPGFARTTTVAISIDLPDARRSISMIGNICYRRLVGEWIYYGIDFDPELSENFDSHQQVIDRYVAKRERELLRARKAG